MFAYAIALTLIVLLGAAVLRATTAPETAAALLGTLRRLTSNLQPLFRYPDLGGYVHDTAMSLWIPPTVCHYVTGTWSDAAGAVANTIAKSKAAADNTGVVTIPIHLPSNSVAMKGSYLKSIDVYYEVLTAALDACSALVHQAVIPADGAAFAAPTAHTFTYDTGHDAAAERIDVDQHLMTLTLTTPVWIDNDDLMTVQMSFDAAATSALTFFGARANFTLRL